MKPLSLILVTLLVVPLPAWSTDLLLFVIQRSKNANEVHYYLRVDAHCNPASDTQVHALWKLVEQSPEQTKPLSVFDQLAYGIAQQTVTESWVSFSLKALETKRMKAHATPSAPPFSRAASVSPSSSSMTRNGSPCSRSYSYSAQMFGCETRAAARASRSNRSRAP